MISFSPSSLLISEKLWFSKTRLKGQNQLHFVLSLKGDISRAGSSLDCSPDARGRYQQSGKSLRPGPIRETRVLLNPITVDLWFFLFFFCLHKPCLRTMGHPFWPALSRYVKQGPYHGLFCVIKPCFCISMSLCLWWSSWGLCGLGTTQAPAMLTVCIKF